MGRVVSTLNRVGQKLHKITLNYLERDHMEMRKPCLTWSSIVSFSSSARTDHCFTGCPLDEVVGLSSRDLCCMRNT